jgi:hypothetical protein
MADGWIMALARAWVCDGGYKRWGMYHPPENSPCVILCGLFGTSEELAEKWKMLAGQAGKTSGSKAQVLYLLVARHD